MTLAELLESVTPGIDRVDAEYLLSHLLNVKRHELYLGTTAVTDKQAADFLSSVDEARSGRPVQYITGSAPFLDFSVQVDERVLIPRPETEQLVARIFELVDDPGTALDFGTGSGCIAIAVARRYRSARVTAADISQGALDVAQLNAERLGVRDRIDFVSASNLADGCFTPLRGRLDLLVSNPPYIPSGRLAALDVRVRDHEPIIALDGGAKGTNILAMIAGNGPGLLAAGGLLALEIDSTQAEEMKAAVTGAVIERDLSGRPRFLFTRKELKI